MAVWDRAAAVLERIDALEEGATFEFLTELDPRALLAYAGELRPDAFAFEQRQLGAADWRVSVKRVASARTDDDPLGVLERTQVFSELPAALRSKLASAMTEHSCGKGHVICAEGAHLSSFGIVLEGALGAFAGAGTRERLLFHVFPFETFGEVELFDAGRSFARIAVVSKTARYAMIPFASMRKMMLQEPRFALGVAAETAQLSRRLAGELAQVALPILARVAAALLPYAPPERGLGPALAPLPTMTQTHLAAAAGTVKEVAARAVWELERAHALRRERGHVRYLDRSKLLQVIAQFS